MFPPEETATKVLVHGDLIPLNILRTNAGEFHIIDWEGVRYDEPEADLVTLVKAYSLDDHQIASLLKGYGRPVDRRMLICRFLLHLLQVVAWRLAVQIPSVSGEKRTAAALEMEREMGQAESILGRWEQMEH
jgi:thiamine kinase-like enzyme